MGSKKGCGCEGPGVRAVASEIPVFPGVDWSTAARQRVTTGELAGGAVPAPSRALAVGVSGGPPIAKSAGSGDVWLFGYDYLNHEDDPPQGYSGYTMCTTMALSGPALERRDLSFCRNRLYLDLKPVRGFPGPVSESLALPTVERIQPTDAGAIGEYCWNRAPLALTSMWPASYWPFDAAGFSWLYMQYGSSIEPGRDLNHDSQQPYRVGAQRLWDEYGRPSFLVSALRPYVAYELLSVATLDEDSDWVSIRVRFYAGLIHHYSFYEPNGAPPFDVTDLGSDVWAGGSRVGFIAARTAHWMGGGAGLSVRVHSESGWRSTAQWFNDEEVGITYQDYRVSAVDGSPTSLCFSNEGEWTAGGMTSLLGNVLWGEVCCVSPKATADVDEMVAEAFEHLFGSRVSIEFSNRWFDPSISETPREVKQYFCLDVRDLQTVGRLVSDTQALRLSAPGRWVFREFDANRLQAVTERAEATAGPCAC